tara:strand:+ start:694 stop:1323 length:630 start_codon:yes stop_codon:yes gene_type:complete
MNRYLFVVATILIVTISHAQTNAITDTGDEVVLYDDGTWTYKDGTAVEKAPIPVNDEKFEKHKDASFLVKSTKIDIGLYMDPKSWSFRKGTENDAYEFQFQKKKDDLYGMLITEKLEIPVESLQNIAIDNARAAAPDLKVTKEEYRMVNGLQVLMMQMTGTIQGMRFTYCGYYYSNEGGAVQLLTYTGEKLFDEYYPEIEKFLNGFVTL